MSSPLLRSRVFGDHPGVGTGGRDRPFDPADHLTPLFVETERPGNASKAHRLKVGEKALNGPAVPSPGAMNSIANAYHSALVGAAGR